MQCTAPGERPCGVCPQCRKVLDGAHPDICIVDDPEKKTIPVKLVRDACTDLYIRPNEGQRKIYLFPARAGPEPAGAERPAQEHRGAASLRHVPAAGGAREQLLPTIRSRCVELRLSPLPEAVLLPALRERFPDVPEGTLRAAGVRAGGYLGRRSPSCGTTPGCCRRVPRLPVPTARGVRRSCCRCSPRWSG